MTIKFETGNTYSTHSPCDHATVISISVLSRTTRTIKTACGKTLRVAEYEGRETVKPWGSYSMAPVIRARSVEAENVVNVSVQMSGAEFEAHLDINEHATPLGVTCAVLYAEPAPHNTAKVSRLADYRK